MSSVEPKKISAVRTYASDLAEVRATRDHTPKTTTAAPTTPTVATAAPQSVAHTTPATTNTVAQKLVFTEPKTKQKTTPIQVVSPVTEKTPTAPKTTIPPFHTFQKPATATPNTQAPVTTINIPNGVVTAKPKASILTGPSHGVTVGDEADAAALATVITDTKKSGFSLTAAVRSSMSGWFQNKKDTLTGKNKPKYTVPQADRRKGVIQKATSMTGRTSTADHAEVVKRLRANKQTTGTIPLTKPKVVESVPTWSSDETVLPKKTSNVLPIQMVAPTIEPVKEVPTVPPVVAPKPIVPAVTPTIPTAVIPKIPTPTVITPPPVITPTISPVARPQITPITPIMPKVAAPVITPRVVAVTPPVITPVVPRVQATPSPISTPITPQVPAPIAVTPPPTIPTVSAMVRPRITPSVPANLQPVVPVIPASVPSSTPDIIRPAAPTPLAAVTEVASVPTTPNVIDRTQPAPKKSFRFQLQSIFTHTNRIVIAGGITACCIIAIGLGYRAYLQADTNTAAVTPTDIPVFSQMVTSSEKTVATSKQVMLTALEAAAAAPDSLTEVMFTEPTSSSTLTAETFFTLFDIQVLTAFTGTITNISLGAYRTEPWILLKVTAAPTAQGGMLDWERRLSRDLSPWFGPEIATKKTSITDFTDSAVNGIDVRILKDTSGTERIIYGFVAPNYILITSNTSAWLNLHEHWRAE